MSKNFSIFKMPPKYHLFFKYLKEMFMITKIGSNRKIHFILPVYNMNYLKSLIHFAVSYALEVSILGRSLESCTPLKILFYI